MVTPANANKFSEGATLLQGKSKRRHFHLANPSALRDITSTFYRIIPKENPKMDYSYIFIECSDNSTEESRIYREFMDFNDPNQPIVRYTGLKGSLIPLSSSEREEIMQIAQDNSPSRFSGRSK